MIFKVYYLHHMVFSYKNINLLVQRFPHHLGVWATKFQISNNEFITKRSRKHKDQLLEPCINHQTLVTNM